MPTFRRNVCRLVARIGLLCWAVLAAGIAHAAALSTNNTQPTAAETPASVYQQIKGSVVEVRCMAIKKIVQQVTTTTTRRLLGQKKPVWRKTTKTTTTTVRASNVGSGVILNAAGYIVTNAHVVYDATSMRVVTADGRSFPASIVGADPVADLAVIKIVASHLQPARLGDSSRLRVGQRVVDLGCPYRLKQTLTHGIISALHRHSNHISSSDDPQEKLVSHEDFIQTDTPTDPGSSGGALADMYGNVIGINVSIASSHGGGFSGVGYVIPSNEVKSVVAQLIAHHKVVHGSLGLSVKAVTLVNPSDANRLLSCLQVSSVAKGGAAQRAGLLPGDLLLSLNGRRIRHVAQLRNPAEFQPVGTHFILVIMRAGVRKTLEAVTTR